MTIIPEGLTLGSGPFSWQAMPHTAYQIRVDALAIEGRTCETHP